MEQTVIGSLGGSPSESEAPLPVAVVIDVEPDGVVGLDAAPWRGFEAGFTMLQSMRREFSQRWGIPVRYNWMLRADLHIEEIYGNAGWAFERYGSELEQLVADGDFLGLHVHPIRDVDRVEDYVDESWTIASINAGIDAFATATGDVPAAVSWSRGWSSRAVLELLNERGVALDMSVFPGRNHSLETTGLEVLADLPGLDNIPPWPYYPSADDWRVEASAVSDGTWIFPHKSTAVDAWIHPGERLARKLTGRSLRSRVEHNYLFAIPRRGFMPYVAELAAERNPYLSVSARSSVFLRKTTDDLHKCFMTLDKVRTKHGCAFSNPLEIRDAYAS